MKILDVFRGAQIEPAWTFSSDGVLWRLLFSSQRGIIVETRDQEKRRAWFLCLDEETGKARWDNLRLKEEWWVGMEAVHDSYLILHGYSKPDMPEHRGVWVVDVEAGNVLWEREELTFWFAFQRRLYAYEQRFDRRIGHVLDLASGATLELYEEGVEPLFPVRQLALEEVEEAETLFPDIAGGENTDPHIAQVLQKQTRGREIVGPVEFLEHRHLLIFNYHTRMRESSPEVLRLRSDLHIFDLKRGSDVYSDTLFEGGSAPVPDSFFVRNDAIYFIRNQHTLVSLRPWKS